MARVWVAEHIALAREVAIKVISEEALLAPVSRKLFEREARATASVDSPHVVRVLDFDWTDEGFPFLVLELLVGETLEDRIVRCGALTLRETATLVDHLGHAISAAHARGILHRDVKAENVFLVRARDNAIDARLLDFGIALPKSSQPLVHGTVGTIQYMSPEQLIAAEVDERSDVFSMAICVYYALTAQLPFRADSLIEMATSLAHRCPSAVQLRPELPYALDAWFAKGLARNPSARFQSVDEATAAFRDVLDRCTPIALEVDTTNEIVVAGLPKNGVTRWMALGAFVALAAIAATHRDRVASNVWWARASMASTAARLGAEQAVTVERLPDAISTQPRVQTAHAEVDVNVVAPRCTPRARPIETPVDASDAPPATSVSEDTGFGQRE